MRAFIGLFIAAMSLHANATTVSADVVDAVAPNYSGMAYSGAVSGKATDWWTPGAGFMYLNRNYDGGGAFTDKEFDLASAFKFGGGAYMETQASFDPDAIILPQFSLAATPRYASGRADFGLGAKYSQYPALIAATIKPDFIYTISDSWEIGAAEFMARSNVDLFASAAHVLYSPSERHGIRIDGAIGQTLEDAGVAAQFNSAAFSYILRFRAFNVAAAYGTYWSEVRTEQTYSLHLLFK